MGRSFGLLFAIVTLVLGVVCGAQAQTTVVTDAPEGFTFETGWDSQFLPEVNYDAVVNAICCTAGLICNWYLDKDGASKWLAPGQPSGLLTGHGTITSSQAAAPTMSSADQDQTYTLRLFLSCGYKLADGLPKVGGSYNHFRSFKVHVSPICRRVTACHKWFQSPLGGPPCCNIYDQCPDGEEGCCLPLLCA